MRCFRLLYWLIGPTLLGGCQSKPPAPARITADNYLTTIPDPKTLGEASVSDPGHVPAPAPRPPSMPASTASPTAAGPTSLPCPMQHQEMAPPAGLRNVIESFWYTRKDFGELPTRFEIAPDGYAEIIFYFGSAGSLLASESGQPLSSPFLVGLLRKPACFQAQNQVELIGIRCFPWTVFELLGLPPGQDGVRRLVHPLAQLQAPLAAGLRAADVAGALGQVARYFEQAQAQRVPDSTLGKAGQAMRAAAGTLPVSQVAAAAHATVRTLERKFKQAAGHSVKDVSGLLRFEQARHRLWLHPAASLAGLAQELGYTDQSHLGREFRRYCGTTPAAFARKAARWQRAVSTDFVAFVLA